MFFKGYSSVVEYFAVSQANTMEKQVHNFRGPAQDEKQMVNSFYYQYELGINSTRRVYVYSH